MTRSLLLALLSLSALLGLDPASSAADIVYKLVDYPAYQNGYHIRDTITTDGTIGELKKSNIRSWQFTILSSSWTPIVSVTSNGPESAQINGLPVIATATTIKIPNSKDALISNVILMKEADAAQYFSVAGQHNVDSVAEVGPKSYWNTSNENSNPTITFATTCCPQTNQHHFGWLRHHHRR